MYICVCICIHVYMGVYIYVYCVCMHIYIFSQLMKLIDSRRNRKIFPVWNKARSKELNDMEKELGILISHLLVMG